MKLLKNLSLIGIAVALLFVVASDNTLAVDGAKSSQPAALGTCPFGKQAVGACPKQAPTCGQCPTQKTPAVKKGCCRK